MAGRSNQLLGSGAEPGLRPLEHAGAVGVRRIRAGERDRFVALELAAFGGDPATARAWLAPQFDAAGFDHCLSR